MRKHILSLLFIFVCVLSFAQPGGPGGPGCWPPEDCLPIDGLSSLLLLGGAAYIGKNRKKIFK